MQLGSPPCSGAISHINEIFKFGLKTILDVLLKM
jgi:hypothetical protein